jgi:hypothetical protein
MRIHPPLKLVVCGAAVALFFCAGGRADDGDNYQRPTMSRRLEVRARWTRGMRGMTATRKVAISGTFSSDSFDPDDPNKSAGGFYDPLKTGQDGFVGTTSKTPNDMNITGTATIVGSIATGAPGVLQGVSGDSVVGSRAYVDAGKKGMEDGAFRDDLNVSFPDANLPFTPPLLDSIFLPEIVNGTNYNYVFKTGNYTVEDLKLAGQDKAIVTGKAVLYVRDAVDITAQFPLIIAPGGSLDIYVGTTATFGGGGLINQTGSSTNFNFYGLKTCTDVTFSGGAALLGNIYAPSTKLNLTGTSDFYGESVSRDLTIGGTFRFHHDESLGRKAWRYIPVAWKEI